MSASPRSRRATCRSGWAAAAAPRGVGRGGGFYSKQQYGEIVDTIRDAAAAAGRADAGFDVGYMPPWTYLLGDVPDGVMALSGGIEPLIDDIRSARAVGANTFHLKFRARDLPEYLDQIDAFAEQVVPLVDEG